MQTRLDLITRSLPQFGQDRGLTTQVPVGDVGTGENSFGNTLTRAINEVSDARDRSGDLTKRFAAGENVELHEVMAASEEAGIALDMLIELRNKVVEAYRSVISMQS
ncbi:MAG TPA: flagellar hook-basal body complex protein FliE [Gemmatimonas aurantiaca]|uniref:Flagellar hook-basal body complex protein FliE n=2 Tax=Gemmatimonas aurantiaca TaxID=173480 RepID=C1A564_GEMAT|nr:flagellar hook-basal body complex protein FliE [Gemmatimonas aurantiaca]BAH37374.1 flagellar hook-basal body complex protein FliE [Gemmatimonas aurantiaca T-27]HCT55790.1 flagellar hook-basal body complex protein FliE [Gemmatimonas aurantiaca]